VKFSGQSNYVEYDSRN